MIFSLNVPDEYIDEGRLELNILIPVVGGNTSVNVPVETKETEAIMLLHTLLSIFKRLPCYRSS